MAKFYDAATKILMLGTYDKVRARIIKEPRAARALDLCCGTGYVTGHIDADNVVALDISPGMLRVNRDKNRERRHVNITVGDAFRLPFPDNSFDAVYNTLAAHEFKKISRIIEEAYRVLKPGGRIVLYDFSYPDSILLRYTYLPFVKHIVELGTFFVYNGEGWRKILKKAGFIEVESESLYGASILMRARK
jgi:demethylmenaquinone methyltransferase/2-methoxy-6-polyprenyl-1,4-benzoquinol methylase